MSLFDFIEDMIWSKKREKARQQINTIWGFDLSETLHNTSPWDVSWYHDKPFVLIVKKYLKVQLIRREFYEFVKGKWTYIGYMNRKGCLDFYWSIKGKEQLDERGRSIRNDNNLQQANRVLEFNLEDYFRYYKKYVMKISAPNDGAVVRVEKSKKCYTAKTQEDYAMDKVVEDTLNDPSFWAELEEMKKRKG